MKIRIKDLIPKKGIIRRYKTYDGDIYKADEVDRYIAHQKMKRCLAMAKVCERLNWEFKDLFYGTDCESLQSVYNYKIEHYGKWQIKWLELAEHYKKEAK